MTEEIEEKRVSALLAFGKEIDPKELFPTLARGASDFVLGDPYAFALATCLDRGTRADIIWTIPFYLGRQLGHLNPYRIHGMSESQLEGAFRALPHGPRYVTAAPRTVKELTSLVVGQFGGDASRMWRGRSAAEVKQTFQSIYGVGPGISSMAVLLLEKAFSFRFDDLDRPGMDIKPDVHTTRVLYRLGLASERSENAAVRAARRVRPEFPGEVDAPLWVVGRRWCHEIGPRCHECALQPVCPRIGVESN